MNENELSHAIIGAAITVHRAMGGPGLLESVYEEALVAEMRRSGLAVSRQEVVTLVHQDVRLSQPLRLDLVVNESVIVECKATAKHHRIFEAQALTCLRLRRLRRALVINFGAEQVRHGLRRIVNNLPVQETL